VARGGVWGARGREGRPGGGEPGGRPAAALTGRPALPALGNWEHRVEGTRGLLRTLLARCPARRLRATGPRAPRRPRGEPRLPGGGKAGPGAGTRCGGWWRR